MAVLMQHMQKRTQLLKAEGVQTGLTSPHACSWSSGICRRASCIPQTTCQLSTPGDRASAVKRLNHLDNNSMVSMQECARSAALDLQVRALCAELNRAAVVTADMGRSVLPALAGIEARLSQVSRLEAGR